MAPAAEYWARVQPYLDRLAIWRGYEQELQTLAIFGIGVTIYTALVFTFYQNISKRKPLHFRTSDRPGWPGRISRLAERAIVFPVLSFLYFTVLAVALFFLVKPPEPADPSLPLDPRANAPLLLLMAMGVVVAVRVTVYLSESMSNDLAKLVPLALLGVTLVDPGYLKVSYAWARLAEATRLWPLLARYFLFFIALEAALSSLRWLVLRATSHARGAPRKNTVSLEVHEPPASVSKPAAPKP